MYNDLKNMYNNLSYKEQREIYKAIEEKQHNIINDFRVKKESQDNNDYSWESGNNILEPIANIIYNVIISVFPGFKKNN